MFIFRMVTKFMKINPCPATEMLTLHIYQGAIPHLMNNVLLILLCLESLSPCWEIMLGVPLFRPVLQIGSPSSLISTWLTSPLLSNAA